MHNARLIVGCSGDRTSALPPPRCGSIDRPEAPWQWGVPRAIDSNDIRYSKNPWRNGNLRGAAASARKPFIPNHRRRPRGAWRTEPQPRVVRVSRRNGGASEAKVVLPYKYRKVISSIANPPPISSRRAITHQSRRGGRSRCTRCASLHRAHYSPVATNIFPQTRLDHFAPARTHRRKSFSSIRSALRRPIFETRILRDVLRARAPQMSGFTADVRIRSSEHATHQQQPRSAMRLVDYKF